LSRPRPILSEIAPIRYPPELPVSQQREAILAAIRAHQVVIVAGETGSGKTTQLPKMCLEAGLAQRGRIGCTQPRRVAAMSVSRRVAEELGCTWGREVGCKMRFADDTGPQTRIKFMTDGILLAEIQSDPLLRAYSTLIIDEAHERSLNIDFLLGYLQQLLARRRELKLVITSATIDTEAFSQAFGGAPVVEVSGRLYPVEVVWRPLESLEPEGGAGDSLSYVEGAVKVVEEALIEYDSGDLLLFMPTERDIREAREQLEGRLGREIDVLGLFGRMASAQQQLVFAPGPRRRVVIATNVAETSLTIPRIGIVVDTGLARISRYNPRTRTQRLPIEPVSQSSANQRMGRAGRLRDGVCIRLYGEEDYLKRPRFTQPEILRSNLAEVILRMKAFRLGEVESFPFLNPPQSQAIRAGYLLLEELGALIEQGAGAIGERYPLTDLGRELASLPIDPILGRMLLQARQEGVLPEVLVIAAGLSVPDPRERPEEAKEAAQAAHREYHDPASDFLSLLHLWNAAPPLEGAGVATTRNALRRFCKGRFLWLTRMREWRDLYRQLGQAMEEARPRGGRRGAAPERKSDREQPRATPEEAHYAAIHRSILTGLLGQIARREERNLYLASGNRKVTLFPGSNLYERQPRKPKPSREQPRKAEEKAPKSNQPPWIMAGEVVQTSQLFARTAARIEPEWVAELGAHLCRYRHLHPEWRAKAGRVLVTERVLIHGLEITRRPVDFGRIDPEAATELFIRGALVAGDARINHRFFRENRKLRERIENTLTKVRSHRLHDLDEAFYTFYAKRLERISSVADLDRWVRERIAREPDLLVASEEELIAPDELAYDREAFPDAVKLENAVIPLQYAYAPGSEEDGVTLRLPLPLAEALTPGQLQWMVPGLREEQAGVLLRALPKAIRKSLMPLEPKIRRIASELEPGSEPFPAALSAFVRRHYGIIIEPGAWTLPPDYLVPRVEVIDPKNRPIAAGRDLEAVRATMKEKGVRSTGWDRAVRQWEKRGLTGWSFGDLPESIGVDSVGGVPLLAFPGLALRDGRVDLKLYRSREEAAASTPAAIVRLAHLVLGEELERRVKGWRVIPPTPPAPRGGKPKAEDRGGVATLGQMLEGLQLSLSATPSPRAPKPFAKITAPARPVPAPKVAAGSHGQVDTATLIAHVGDHLFRLEPLLPLTRARFEAMLTAALEALPEALEKTARWCGEVLELRGRIAASPRRYDGMEADLERLVPARFLAATPHGRLRHLPRYLKAVATRAERAWLHPAKDTQKAAALRPLEGWERRVAPANREKFRWLLEEFRVSLFAQELGTAEPVSARRLQELLNPSS